MTVTAAARPARAATPGGGDAAAAFAYGDIDLTAEIAVLRGLALASVTAAVRGRRRRDGRPGGRRHGLVPRSRIDGAAIAVLWPVVVAPWLAGRRGARARTMLLAPLPGQDPNAPGAAAVPDLAVMAAAAVTPPRRLERLVLALRPAGGVVAGAAIFDFVAAAALRQPALVSALDAVMRTRLCPEVLLPRGTAPMTLSDRGVLTVIAMMLVPRPLVRLPTRRQRFERAFTDRVAALWGDGDVPRGCEAWLLTEALRSAPARIDPRLAAVARAAGLLGCPRFAPPGTTAAVTADYATMPEPLERFLRRQF